MTRVHTIINGGQTGADRGSAEAARDLGLKRGGWAPAGWRAEDGVIPQWYRVGMMESASSAYPVRTRANVEASGGTLILSFEILTHDSGSMLTAKLARQLGKPSLNILLPNPRSRSYLSSFELQHIREWITGCKIRTLNVAGPRESREPGIQAATRAALVQILGEDVGFGWDP